MTAKDCYYKAYALNLVSKILMPYIYKDGNGMVQIGSSIAMDFNQGHEHNIQRMETFEKECKGFMYWGNDDEWKKLAKIKWNIKPYYDKERDKDGRIS